MNARTNRDAHAQLEQAARRAARNPARLPRRGGPTLNGWGLASLLAIALGWPAVWVLAKGVAWLIEAGRQWLA